MTLVASTEPAASLDGASALRSANLAVEAGAAAIVRARRISTLTEWPAWIRQLILAADQFIIGPASRQGFRGSSVIAGYPWFADWGRDTMIALPGLLLATGRRKLPLGVLRTYARLVDRGMLPNRFPECWGRRPNTTRVDAALWFFEAVRQYYAATHDLSLVREIFPAMSQIIDEYTRGTRYNIHVDSTDGLLYAGEPGVQLTWMDCQGGRLGGDAAGGQTRGGQRALVECARHPGEICRRTGKSLPPPYSALAAQARQGFQRFWNPDCKLLL